MTTRAWAEMLLLSLLWGGSFLAFRVAVDEIGVLTTVVHRVVWAALILWAYVLIRGFAIPRDLRVWGAFFVMGVLNNAIPFSLIAWGQLHIETGLASIFNASTAIFGVVIASLVFADEHLGPRKMLGVMIGFLGVTVTIGPASLAQFDLRSIGQLALLGAGLSYGLAAAWARARLGGLAPQVAAAGMLTGSSILMVPVAMIVEGPVSFDLRPETYWAIGYASVAATALAYLLYYRILGMAGSGNLMLVTLLIPPFAIVLGSWVRDEALTPSAHAGFALLAFGLMVIDGRIIRRG